LSRPVPPPCGRNGAGKQRAQPQGRNDFADNSVAPFGAPVQPQTSRAVSTISASLGVSSSSVVLALQLRRFGGDQAEDCDLAVGEVAERCE